MLAGLKALLGPTQAQRMRYFGYRDGQEWVREMGGASAGRLPTSVLDYVRFAASARRLGALYINGADVLDGKYSLERSLQRLRLAQFAADLGAPVTLTGFSLREDLPAEIRAAFRTLPAEVRLCARDPRTRSRLEALLERPVVQVADLAFLMNAAADEPHEQDLLQRLETQRRRGRRLVGLCLNLHAVQLPGLTVEARVQYLLDCMAQAWRAVHRDHPDCLPVVLPHDFRGTHNDAVLGASLGRRCGWSEDTAIVVDRPCTAQAIKRFCGLLDVLITGRMHCGIAALGSGVPAVLFDYQGKVDGLLDLFGLSSSVQAGPDRAACAHAIHRQASAFLSNREATRQQIRQALPTVQALAAANRHPLALS